ncbi:MAG: hypothetical protein OEV08_02135 [Nitrospira sp.]|nr:hypothetical protein [Nitrospira sp.]
MFVRTAAVICMIVLAGCAGPLTQWGEDTTFTPRASSFDPASLKQDPVAVLHAVVGFGLEGYSHQVSRSLSAALANIPQTMHNIPVQEGLSRINREGLAGEYAQMVSDYAKSGILNRATLERIGKTLNVTYVFQPSMASFSQATAGRFSFFGLRLFQTRITTMRLAVQLWNARTGDIVWEASGEATLATEDVRELRIPFDAIAQRLWSHMLNNLFLDLPTVQAP